MTLTLTDGEWGRADEMALADVPSRRSTGIATPAFRRPEVTILVRGTDPCRPTIEVGQPQHVRSGISADVLAAIDLLNLGILVLDREGRITFANRAAKALLQGRGGKDRREGRAAFDRIRAATARREATEGCFTPSTANRKSLIVLSVPSPNNDSGTGAASSIVFVADPTVEAELDLRPITRLYGLTRAETRLLQALVGGERVGTYAKQAGITLNTAKGYLKQLFGKTQIRRQSDLLRLVLSNPLLRLVSSRPRSEGQ